MSAEIASLRRRLLDVNTKKNPLISYKHALRGARFVRVVDEVPDHIYARLVDGQLFRFKSLGEQSDEPDDEKTIMFRRALEAAKNEDEDFQNAIEKLGDAPGERAIQQLEIDLRSRVREKLGMSPRRATETSPAFVAMSKGINPAYDLPTAAADKHSDAYIQTLLFDGDLEHRLAQIRDRVRLSMDETGVNTLFCVFGFLEWYEDDNSHEPIHAPLLLYPLEIDRLLYRGRYHYTIKSTGEGAVANEALRERLKSFGIELPAFTDDDEQTPEQYWAQVQEIVDSHKGWKVRRWVTVIRRVNSSH